MAIKNLKQLEAAINKKIAKALQTEVAETAKRVMSETIKDVTYQQYSPTEYIRREDNNGLSDVRNMETTVQDDNTISIRNMTEGNTSYPQSYDGLIDEIIVSGAGYTWEGSQIYGMQPYPRDFYADTVEELKNTNELTYAMYKGLQKQGLNVKR